MLERTIPLDLSVQISTPENIRFDYRLAGPFRRLPAFVLDFIFRLLFVIVLSIAFAFSGIGSLIPFGDAFFIVMLLISLFFLEWFYGVFFETFWNGQTPGKRLLGLRVISIDGHPINAVQATIRNFLRFADFFPFVPLSCIFPEMVGWVPIFTVSIVSMLLTSRMQRLGDIAAGTMVVIDEKTWFTRHAKLDDPRAPMLAEHIPPSFVMSRSLAQTIALYVERRPLISMARRLELANRLAKPLFRKFGFRDDTSSDLLLCALYYRDFVAKQADALSLDSLDERPATSGHSMSPLTSPLAASTAPSLLPEQAISTSQPGVPSDSPSGTMPTMPAAVTAPKEEIIEDVAIVAEVAEPTSSADVPAIDGQRTTDSTNQRGQP
jgi:uncharacterized RDD family membrane protein YckC